MARRDINNLNTVTDVVAKEPDHLLETASALGEQIIKQSQEAKIVENMSAAQLDLGKLSDDYQTQYEGDPFNKQGLEELRSARQGVLDKYGESISPVFRRAWNENAQKISSSNESQVQAWGYKQSAVNSKTSLIAATQNHLTQAQLDGEAFGKSTAQGIGSFSNFITAKQSLEEFGAAHLGETSTQEVTKDFSEDYAKVFVSGVAHTNPVKALKMLDNEQVRSAFTKPEEFQKFRDAVETRAINVGEVAKQQEVLGVLKKENALFTGGKALSYAEIQQATAPMSEEAKKYFMKANGYSAEDADGPAWKLDQKLQYKAEVYDQITKLAGKENIDPAEVVNLQSAIYKGMSKGAMTQVEGANFITQLLEPAIAGKEEQLQDFTGDTWNPFKANVGLEGIQQHFEDNIAIKPAEGKTLGPTATALNSANKAQLYENYFGALDEAANKRGIKIADIPSQNDSYEIYKQAQAEAIQKLNTRTTPVLKLQPAIPISAIVYLTKNPKAADQFDEKYGTGAANRVLGK